MIAATRGDLCEIDFTLEWRRWRRDDPYGYALAFASAKRSLDLDDSSLLDLIDRLARRSHGFDMVDRDG